jgi:hypothetical protein
MQSILSLCSLNDIKLHLEHLKTTDYRQFNNPLAVLDPTIHSIAYTLALVQTATFSSESLARLNTLASCYSCEQYELLDLWKPLSKLLDRLVRESNNPSIALFSLKSFIQRWNQFKVYLNHIYFLANVFNSGSSSVSKILSCY